MTQKLSRRDALKVLGAAAGATALANLPAKWTTPKLEAGVLPAHAQSSGCVTVTLDNLTAAKEICVQTYVAPTSESLYPEIDGTGCFSPDFRYVVMWECRSGCLQVHLAGTWSLEIEGPNPPVSTSLTDSDLLVNLETGKYSTDIGVPPDGCFWT